MKSLSTLTNLGTSLAQNITGANQALLIQLMSDQHRYLIQKYFDNEKTYQTTTVGGQSLTTTATMALGATSATLTVTWAYPTVTQLVNFSNSDQRSVLFTTGSATISWVGGLSSSATTAISSVGAQAYAIPATISKIKNNSISVGQLKYQASPVQTIQEWTQLNTLPYTSSIVNYFFIYNGNLLFYPIPSSTGLLIEINYKSRVPDFSTQFLFSDAAGTAYVAGQTTFDYQKGTASGSVGSTTITGASTPNWLTPFPMGDVTKYNLYFMAAPPKGDGIWYPISTIDSNTQLTLALPLINAVIAGATYSIGQMPLLSEDFADMIPYGALLTYFSTLVEKPGKFKQFQAMYGQRLELLEQYAGTKSQNVDLGGQYPMNNPNLFYFGNGSST